MCRRRTYLFVSLLLLVALLLSACRPVVRSETPAQAVSQYQPPAVLVHGALIRSPNGIKAGTDGNLYVASVAEQAILVINPETGEIIKRLGPEVGVDGPDDLAFGPDGSIYWTDLFKGTVGRLAPDGSTSSQMVAPGVNPIALSQDGRLFVGLAFLGDALYELDPNLVAPPRLLAEKLGGLNSFQFGPDGMLYSPVMEKGQVVRIDVDADPIKVEVVAEGLSWPVAVKFDSQGRLYTTNPPGIVRVDMLTGATEPVATVPYGIDNFAFDAQDRLFVSLLAEGTVTEAMANGDLRMLGPAGLVMPGGVVVSPRADGESVFVADGWLLHEFDGATGELRRKVDNLGPNTVALDGDNLLLSGWFSNGVVVWNPQTETVVEEYYDFNMPLNAVRFQGDLVVAELGTGSVVRASAADPTQRTTLVKDLSVPAGLATNGEDLWVSDRATGNVWQLAAGGELLPEPKLAASGLDRPEGMTLAADGRLLVAEAGTGRLLVIDPATSTVSTTAEGLEFSQGAPEGAPPTFVMNSVAVDTSGVIYATGDRGKLLYRIEPSAAAAAEMFPNRELAEQFASLWVQPDKTLLDTIVSPDLVYENVDVMDIHDKASLGWKIRDVRAFAPDFHESLLDAFGEGDWYVGRSRFDATLSNTPVSYGGLNLVHVVDGRIAEVWSVSDEVAVSRIFNEMRNDEKRMQFLWGDDSTVAGDGGTPQANKQLAAEWLQGDAAAQENLAHDQFVFHSTLYPDKHTYQERAAVMQDLKTGFPDLQVKVDSPVIAAGDKVGFHFTMSGTNSGSFMGSAPNGRAYTWPGIAIYRMADGKIAEEWFLLSAYAIFKMVELQPKRSS